MKQFLLNIIDLSTIFVVTSDADDIKPPKSTLSIFMVAKKGTPDKNCFVCSIRSGKVFINELICSPPVTIIGIKNKNPIKSVPKRTMAEDAGRLIFLNFSHILSTIGFNEQDITNAAKNRIAISLICAIKIINNIARTKNIKFLIPTCSLKNLII